MNEKSAVQLVYTHMKERNGDHSVTKTSSMAGMRPCLRMQQPTRLSRPDGTWSARRHGRHQLRERLEASNHHHPRNVWLGWRRRRMRKGGRPQGRRRGAAVGVRAQLDLDLGLQFGVTYSWAGSIYGLGPCPTYGMFFVLPIEYDFYRSPVNH